MKITFILDSIKVTLDKNTIKNLNIPIKPDFKMIPASNVLISEDTSTCTASNQK